MTSGIIPRGSHPTSSEPRHDPCDEQYHHDAQGRADSAAHHTVARVQVAGRVKHLLIDALQIVLAHHPRGDGKRQPERTEANTKNAERDDETTAAGLIVHPQWWKRLSPFPGWPRVTQDLATGVATLVFAEYARLAARTRGCLPRAVRRLFAARSHRHQAQRPRRRRNILPRAAHSVVERKLDRHLLDLDFRSPKRSRGLGPHGNVGLSIRNRLATGCAPRCGSRRRVSEVQDPLALRALHHGDHKTSAVASTPCASRLT